LEIKPIPYQAVLMAISIVGTFSDLHLQLILFITLKSLLKLKMVSDESQKM